MVYVALAFLAAYSLLFVWLTTKAFRASTVYGLGWFATKADRPVTYWLGVTVYVLNLAFGLIFLALMIAKAVSR